MARFVNAQRRAVLVFATIICTFLIRLISVSAGHSQRGDHSNLFVSDKGSFKQAALMVHGPKASYLLRIANFFPFVSVENRGLRADWKAIMSPRGSHPAIGQQCNDCDCDCGDCSGCGGCCFGCFFE